MTYRTQTNNVSIYINTAIKVILIFHGNKVMSLHVSMICSLCDKGLMLRVMLTTITCTFELLLNYNLISAIGSCSRGNNRWLFGNDVHPLNITIKEFVISTDKFAKMSK